MHFPERRSSGVAFAVVTAGLMTITAGTAVATPLLTLFTTSIGITPLQSVVLYASYSLGILLALVGVALAGDRISLSGRVVLALALAAVAAGTFVATTDFVLLLVARVISGLASGAVASTAVTVLVALGGPERRERSSLIGLAGNFGGLAAGAVLGGAGSSIGGDSPQLPFLVIAVLAVVLLAGTLAVRGTVRRSTQSEGEASVDHHPPLGRLQRYSRPVFLRAVVPAMIAFPSNALVSTVASSYLPAELGTSSRAAAGIVIAVGFAATAAGQLVVRWRPATIGRLRGCVTLFVGLAALLTALVHPTWFLFVLGSALIGAGTGIITGVGVAAITALPDHGETAGLTTRYFVLLYVSIFIPLTALGVLAGTTGVIDATSTGCAVGLVALLALSAVSAVSRLRRV